MSDTLIPASALAAVGAKDTDEFFTMLAKNCVKESNASAMTEARITQIAEAAGSRKAAEALGACGVTPPAPPSMPHAAHVKPPAVAVRTAAAKRRPESQQPTQSAYAEQFAASKELQDEFGELDVFVAYMKAKRNGQIKVIE